MASHSLIAQSQSTTTRFAIVLLSCHQPLYSELFKSSAQMVGHALTIASRALLSFWLYSSGTSSWKPETFFALFDDALFISTAQALAQHQGYILPSFPGRPLRPQVPILYPLLLSGVWRLDPRFPENLVWAIRLTEGFGCVVLLCAFFLFRCIARMGRVPSLVLTALCAFHPVLLRLSGLTLSDVPFAAMFLLTILIAHFALSPGKSYDLVATLGIVVASPLRTLGLRCGDRLVALYPLPSRIGGCLFVGGGHNHLIEFVLGCSLHPPRRVRVASGWVSSRNGS
jgi:hypothetical protein